MRLWSTTTQPVVDQQVDNRLKIWSNSMRTPERNVDKLSHFGYACGQRVRGNNVEKDLKNLENKTRDTS